MERAPALLNEEIFRLDLLSRLLNKAGQRYSRYTAVWKVLPNHVCSAIRALILTTEHLDNTTQTMCDLGDSLPLTMFVYCQGKFVVPCPLANSPFLQVKDNGYNRVKGRPKAAQYFGVCHVICRSTKS